MFDGKFTNPGFVEIRSVFRSFLYTIIKRVILVPALPRLLTEPIYCVATSAAFPTLERERTTATTTAVCMKKKKPLSN